MTKPVTSVAIMVLCERGLIELDEPVERHLPELANRVVFETFDAADGSFTTRPAATPIALRHLLSHTAGFGYMFCNDRLAALKRHGRHWAHNLPDVPLLHDPGHAWTYGSSTAVLFADGGLIGTAADYVHFLQMMLTNGQRHGVRVLSEASVSEMTRNQIGVPNATNHPAWLQRELLASQVLESRPYECSSHIATAQTC